MIQIKNFAMNKFLLAIGMVTFFICIAATGISAVNKRNEIEVVKNEMLASENVQNMINEAQEGATIHLPAGSAVWTTGININK